ncbi:MAG: S49 family peptidase [Gammaproteobacteria bacterium]
MNNLDLFWAIHSQSMDLVATRLQAYARHIEANGIEAGPAEDAQRDGYPIHVTGGVAVIPLMGPMIRRAGPFAMMFGIVGTDMVRAMVETALADEEIHTILLRVDSPGGSVSGLAELADSIHSAEKPVIAQIEGMAASAAYYIASQCDKVYLGRSDLVGSIGARLMLYDYSIMYEEAGVKAIPIDTGEFKSAGAVGTEITEEHQADFQRIVDFYFDDFVQAVMRGRDLTDEQVRAVGDGRMYTPKESMAAGLVDGIATIDQTLSSLRQESRNGRSTQAAKARLRA